MVKKILIFGAAFSFWACNKELEYIDSIPAFDNANVAQVDTFTVKGTITRPDSVQTSGLEYFKFGRLNDPGFGVTSCFPVTGIGLPLDDLTLEGNYYYDSLVLTVKSGRSWQGDTTQPFTIVVKRLSADLDTESGALYSHHRFGTYEQALGSAGFLYRPSLDDSLFDIRLDDTFGKTLFDMFRANDPIIREEAVFRDWFKGLELSMQTSGAGMMMEVPQSSGDGIQFRLHYHIDNGRDQENAYLDFSLTGASAYTYMETNRTGTQLSSLDSKTELTIDSESPLLYSQSLTDVRTEFSFPGIKELLKKATYFSLVESRLIVRPQALTSSFFPYPAQLYAYVKDISGTETGPLTDAASQTLDGDFYYDAAYPHNSYYSFDVTSFVQNELTSTDLTTLKLVLRNGDNSSTLTRLVAGLPGNKQYTTQLIVTYLLYNP